MRELLEKKVAGALCALYYASPSSYSDQVHTGNPLFKIPDPPLLSRLSFCLEDAGATRTRSTIVPEMPRDDWRASLYVLQLD